MTKEDISQIVTDALKPIGERLTTLEANAKPAATAAAANAGADNKIIELVQTAIKPFSEKIEKLETENKAQVLAQAKATVQTLGVKAGRIAAQDAETIKFWEETIAANAKATAALEKIQINPAFVQIVQAGANGGSTTGTAGEHEFVKLVNAKAKDGKSKAEAMAAVINEHNAVYTEWLKAGAGKL